MATIQKPIVDTIIEPKLELIDKIRGETLDEIAIYLENRDIEFGYLPDFLVDPQAYPGNKITGLKQITERFLDLTISKYYKQIQAEGLTVKFVINTVRKNLVQGGWDVKRHSNITMALGESKSPSPLLEFNRRVSPRLLIVKNKDRKVRSKPKSISKKKTIKIKTSKTGRKGFCDYCGARAKNRASGNMVHINITQNPSHHRFCSRDCKTEWIHTLLNNKRSQEG